MLISLIVAVADNGVIGKTGSHHLLWHQGDDIRRFRRITNGHPIVMGRTTYETFRRPLPDRQNIVVTHDPDYQAEGCTVAHSIDEALRAGGEADEIFIIGGAKIYEQTLPLADKIYLTRIHAEPKGDAFFRYDAAEWSETDIESHPADENNDHPYTYVTLVKNTTS